MNPARLAWGMAAATAGAVVADAVVVARFQPLLSEETVAVHGFPFISGAVLGSAAMGALVISRDPRHPIGWLLNLIGVITGFALLAEGVSIWIVDEGGPGPRALGGVAGWLSMLLGGPPALAGIAVLFLLAPAGRLLSPRWRIVGAVPVLGLACCVAALAFVTPASVDLRETEFGGSLPTWASGILLLAVGLVAALVSMVVRLRRSDGQQRQQLRLIATSAALVAAGFTIGLTVQLINGGEQTWASALPLFVSYFLLPILFAVAVLRYRLFDIEVILNRALVLALGTAFAGLGYTVLVVLAARLVDTRTGDFWVSIVATALVALAFQPARQGVVHLANRVAFGPRARPYEALAGFSRKLSATPSPRSLLETVAEAATRTVAADDTRVVLQAPGTAPVSVSWPAEGSRGSPTHSVAVADEEAVLGRIDVWLPPGRPLTPGDQLILADLAEHSAVAFRNVAMESRLAARVAELDHLTRELTESRRRVVEAEDAARRALEAALSRDLLPRLKPLPERIRVLSGAPLSDAGQVEVEHLAQEITTALESLRALTRGVFPAVLARAGVAAALRSRLDASAPSLLHVDPSADRRFPDRVESAAYAVCIEAASADSALEVWLHVDAGDLVVNIPRVDLAQVDRSACADRVGAAGGSLVVGENGLVARLPLLAERTGSVP